MSVVLERALAARASGKILVVVGLRAATPEEISGYKAELKERNIQCMHKRKKLRFNGILCIYPTNEKHLFER